eukprot:TRINITY_DN6260_c0_g1_i1.p1 TRINITY_DN6260_c0_g1~~TRINITY_DN6260_c0_g1_i1.p1  ORF type:complete len:227 (-),score=5.57 TRINITY_DN6260_c0_g1_i1:329-1009(-)
MSDQYEDFQSENSLSLLIVLLLVLCVLSYLPHYLSYLLILSTLAFLAIVVYHLKHVQQKQKNQQQVDNQNQSQSQNNEAKKLSTDANRRPNQEIDDDVLNQLQLPQQQEDYSPQKKFQCIISVNFQQQQQDHIRSLFELKRRSVQLYCAFVVGFIRKTFRKVCEIQTQRVIDFDSFKQSVNDQFSFVIQYQKYQMRLQHRQPQLDRQPAKFFQVTWAYFTSLARIK